MTMFNRISNYWLCQIAGWSFVGLSYVFAAYAYGRKLTTIFFLRIILVVVVGIIITHLLRLVIRQLNWLLQPIEKVLPKVLLAVLIASLTGSLLVVGVSEFFNLSDAPSQLSFSLRLLTNTMDIGLFIVPWVLIYYFYHYLTNGRKQQLTH